MTSTAELTVYSSKFSPYGQRVFIAVKEKGIPANFVIVDLPNKPKELLEANPIHGKVPAIMHNGKGLGESMVILNYLEDVWPNHVPLLPADAYEKAQMRFWAEYVLQFFTKMYGLFSAGPGSTERANAAETAATGLKTLEAAMANYSAEGPYFAGDKFGFVDVVLAPAVVALPVLEKLCDFSIPGADVLPRFYKWTDTIGQQKSVKETLPTREEAMAKFSAIAKQRFPAAATTN